MASLVSNGLSVAFKNVSVVSDVSLAVAPGELVVLLGANGAGKSTLIKAMIGIQPTTSGLASIDGENARTLSSVEKAKRVAYLPQVRPLAWPNTVHDVVSLGRYCYGAVPGRVKGDDAKAVDAALQGCDLEKFAHRSVDTLSGGELARVHCARAFASQAPLFVADEPTAALDPRHQLMIMELIHSYVVKGAGALVVLHDVNLAIRFATRLAWMCDGRIVADGAPTETVTEDRMARVYGVNARVKGSHVEMLGVC